MSSDNIYYVYAYLRNKDSATAKAGTPYYIGKGTGNRYSRPHGRITVPLSNDFLKIVESNLTNIGACALERRLIAWYGRKDLHTGILLNLTDGGEGTRGYARSEDERKSISDKLRGRIKSESHLAAIRKSKSNGVPTDVRKKISESMTGNIPWNKGITGKQISSRKGKSGIYNAEIREKMGAGNRGKHHSDEVKTARSIRMKEWWASRK